MSVITNKPKHVATPWVILVVTYLILASFAVPVTAESKSTALSVTIQGSPTVFSTPALDICTTIHLGSCPIYLAVNEGFSQSVAITFTTDKPILQPGDSTSVTASVNPSSPSATLNFVFTFLGKSFTYPYQISSFPPVGSGGVGSVPIPVGALTTALALPPLPITLNIDLQVSSVLLASLQTTGFSGNSVLVWSSPGTQQTALGFSGNSETVSIGLNMLKSIQDWQVSVKAGVPLIGSVQLYSTTVQKLEIQSNSAPVFSWYHVSVSSQYSSAPGSGWYLSGTPVTILVTENTVSITQSERRVFTGWIGTGAGSYSGTGQTVSLVANAPISEVAQWKTQYLVSVEQSLGGTTSPGSGSQWYDDGYQLALQAIPTSSYQFKDWLINNQVVSTSPGLTYAVSAPASIKAEFTQVQSPSLIPGIDNNVLLGAAAVIVAGAIIGIAVRRRRT